MSVPDFQTLMRPILVALSDGQTHSSRQVREVIAATLGLSDEDQAELLPSGRQTTYSNRIAWALSHMGQAGVIARPMRGSYRLTDRGRALLEEYPDRVDMSVLDQFPEYVDFRKPKQAEGATAARVEPSDVPPSEAIGRLVAEADAQVAADLLDLVLGMEPVFLERLALRLLQAMGYGGRESVFEHTGKSGDAGLDGIISQDALGLELVGVQAKRYDKNASVQRPEIQAFAGALQGAQTSRGVFVTTGRFSSGAKEFAKDVAMRLILIDGKELSSLMVRYGVGVSSREVYELKQVDEEFFEE